MMEYKVKTSRLIFSSNGFNIVAGKNLETEKSVKLEFHQDNIPLYANLVINGKEKGVGRFPHTIVVSNFDFLLTNNKVDMVAYLSQPDFKGIGKKTAQKIVEKYGEYVNLKDKDTHIDKEIIGNPEPLRELLGYAKAQKVIETLIAKEESFQLDKKLAKLGINAKILEKLRKKHVSEPDIAKILDGNLYEWNFNNENFNFSFKYVDEMVYKLNHDLYQKEHYKWVLLGDLKQYFFNTGNTWVSVNDFGRKEMSQMSKHEFEKNLVNLVNKKAIKLTDDNTKMTFATFFYKEQENAQVLAKNSINLHHKYSKEEIKTAINKVEQQISPNFHYDEEQKAAIQTMLNNKVMLLQGKAGTGKSKTVQGFVKTYLELLRKNELVDSDTITLLAPTGKAATRLNEIDNSFHASTIHSFLNINPFESENILDNSKGLFGVKKCGLVIVDEASMLDIFTLNMILTRIMFDKLVFVGDINQLPSVNVGDVLWDMEKSHTIPTAKLTTIHRAESDSGVISLANAIAENKVHKAQDISQIQSLNDDLDKNIPGKVSEIVNELIRENVDLNNFQFLAPIYKTKYGIDWLNTFIQKKYHNIPDEVDDANLNKWLDGKKINKNTIISIGDKVLFTKNNSDTDTTNGETGIVKSMEFDSKRKLKAMIIHSFVKNEDILFESDDVFDELTLGYAVSVHKSQGSEYDKVFVVWDTDGNNFFDKRNIYTAITRSKNQLSLLGNSVDFLKTIKNQPHKRNTYMLQMLRENSQRIELTDEEFFELLMN